MQTLSDYLTIVKRTVDSSSTSEEPQLEENIKASYQDILRKVGRWIIGVSTYSASASTSTVTPPSFVSIEGVFYKAPADTDWRTLTEIKREDFYDSGLNLDDATPSEFYINAGGIELVPAPDVAGTARVDYVPSATILTGDVESVIPERYEDVVKNGAAWRYFAFDDNPKAPEYERYFLNGLDAMETEYRNMGKPLSPKFFGECI